LSDTQSSRPARRDFRGGGGGFNRGGFRRDRSEGPAGPSVDYKALIEYVAKSLAEKPEEVLVESFERGGGTIAIKVKLADGDVGRFIGKAGRNIEAIASLKDRKRVFVDLANAPETRHEPRSRGPRNGGTRG
jgi:predicted RNA-binding protein YlqC (UPF0109 family)